MFCHPPWQHSLVRGYMLERMRRGHVIVQRVTEGNVLSPSLATQLGPRLYVRTNGKGSRNSAACDLLTSFYNCLIPCEECRILFLTIQIILYAKASTTNLELKIYKNYTFSLYNKLNHNCSKFIIKLIISFVNYIRMIYHLIELYNKYEVLQFVKWSKNLRIFDRLESHLLNISPSLAFLF